MRLVLAVIVAMSLCAGARAQTDPVAQFDLEKGKELIETNAHDGMRKVIDLSADSMANTSGPPIPVARRDVLDAGIVINGSLLLHDRSKTTIEAAARRARR